MITANILPNRLILAYDQGSYGMPHLRHNVTNEKAYELALLVNSAQKDQVAKVTLRKRRKLTEV